jgi:hypothetical protein
MNSPANSPRLYRHEAIVIQEADGLVGRYLSCSCSQKTGPADSGAVFRGTAADHLGERAAIRSEGFREVYPQLQHDPR